MIKLIPSLEMLEDILRTIRIQDVLDILIVAYLVYKLIDLLRETRAGQLIKGVLGIILVYVLSQAFSHCLSSSSRSCERSWRSWDAPAFRFPSSAGRSKISVTAALKATAI